ncbi:MAG: L,D-transpeptidase [Patescibacteria group bacterium]
MLKLKSIHPTRAFILLTLLLAYATHTSTTVFSEQATFGDLSLKNKTVTEGTAIVKNKLAEPIYLNFESKSRSITPTELGINVNIEMLKQMSKTCYKTLGIRYLCVDNNTKNITSQDTLEINNELLNPYVLELNTEMAYLKDNTVVSLENYTFKRLSKNATVVIAEEKLTDKSTLANLIGASAGSIILEPKIVDDNSSQKKETEAVLDLINRTLLIKYGRNPVYIPAGKIAEFTSFTTKDGITEGHVATDNIHKYLEELGQKYESENVAIILPEAVDAIARALIFRAANYQINTAIVLPLEGKPITNGDKADVYLEVVKSQQRLYRWEQGKVVKTYIVSTGRVWETPPGQYNVLGKQKLAISYVGDWYMPNYLPIGTIYGYRFGFHAIPYHLDGAGNIYARDKNTMGSPATGGCIQLTQEESLEIYEWATVGTPVYIFE